MKIPFAIFDMDGTLIDSLPFWGILWEELGRHYRQDPTFTPSEEDDKAVRTLTLADAMNLIHRQYGMAESGEALLAFTEALMVDFYTHRVVAKKGAVEFLQALQNNGTRMCLASATAKHLLPTALRRCGLEGYFEASFSCADLGKGKDEPDVYLAACRYFGIEPREAWLFEDSLVAIQTADRLGMHTVGIFDRYNYGQDEIRALATLYIAEGETLTKLL